jgi:hypothetical protein
MGSKIYRRVAIDLTLIQLKWSAWFLAIVFLIYIAFRSLGGGMEVNGQDMEHFLFLDFNYQPSRIFMLVIGIISVSGFLTFFVKQGVTRRDYFYGAAISSAALTLILLIFAIVVTGAELLLIPEAEKASIAPRYDSWFFTTVVYGFNILVYHSAGWLIGAGFYRSYISGYGSIVAAVLLIGASEILWSSDFEATSSLFQMPQWLSVVSTLLIYGLALWSVRLTTRRVRIKLK